MGECKGTPVATTIGGKMDTNTAIHETLSKGLAAYEQQQYEEALKLLLPIAEAGNPEAQFRVGGIYDGGYGVQQDEETACTWYKKAAAQGHTLALAYHLFKDVMAEISHSYHIPRLEGLNLVKETEGCVANLTKMADKNDCEAIVYLGMLIVFSPHIESNFDLAAAYAIKGAQLNDPDCMILLGLLLLFCGDLKDNPYSTIEWLEKAYELGSRIACHQLGTAYLEGDGVKRNPKKAFQFFEEAANKGSAEAALSAGKCKAYGIGTSQCEEVAYDRFFFAAKNGNREAQYYLATINRTLSSIHLPDEEKMKWLSEAARRGFPPAIGELGYRFMGGRGVGQNVERGIQLIRQAASLSDAEAQFVLGRMYELGEHLPYNLELAIRCYADAAENGSLDAHVHYGFALVNGNGVKRDPVAAGDHFTEAFERGNPHGGIGLGYYHAQIGNRVMALGYFDYAIGMISDRSAEKVRRFREGLIDVMTEVEISDAREYALQIGRRGTA
jgi:uncharacterized protein